MSGFPGNYDNQAVYHDPKTGSNYLMATWGSISGTPKLTFSFHVDSHYKKGGTLKDSGAKMPSTCSPISRPMITCRATTRR